MTSVAFQSVLRKQIRKLPKNLKSVKIIHYCSLLFICVLGPSPRRCSRSRRASARRSAGRRALGAAERGLRDWRGWGRVFERGFWMVFDGVSLLSFGLSGGLRWFSTVSARSSWNRKNMFSRVIVASARKEQQKTRLRSK